MVIVGPELKIRQRPSYANQFNRLNKFMDSDSIRYGLNFEDKVFLKARRLVC